jgi:hypothetical protein
MACGQLDGPCPAASHLRCSLSQPDTTDLTGIRKSPNVCIIADQHKRVQVARVAWLPDSTAAAPMKRIPVQCHVARQVPQVRLGAPG